MKKLAFPLVIGSAAVAASLALGGAPAQASVETTQCPDTLTLYVGGTKSFATFPWSDPEVASIPQRDRYSEIPNSEIEEIDYPASIFPFWGWENWMDDSVDQGAANTKIRIAEQEAKCGAGKTQYLIVGYSQGAEVAGDVGEYYVETDPEFAKSNINIVKYSDPQNPGGVSDIASKLHVNILGKIVFTGARTTTAEDYRTYENYCEPTDGVCDMGKPFRPFWLTKALVGYLTKHDDYHDEEYNNPTTYVPPTHVEPEEPAQPEPVEEAEVIVVEASAPAEEPTTEAPEPAEVEEPAEIVEPAEDIKPVEDINVETTPSETEEAPATSNPSEIATEDVAAAVA